MAPYALILMGDWCGDDDGRLYDDLLLAELQEKAPKEETAADTRPKLEGMEYRIVVNCRSEEHQRELLERFEGEALTCKLLTV